MVLAMLVMAAVLVLCIKGISEPFMALLALLTVYIAQPGELFPPLGYLHVERVVMVIVAVSFFANGKHLKFPPVTKGMLYFYGAMLLSVPFSFWVSNSVSACIQFFETVLIHLLIVALVVSEKQVKTLIVTLVGLNGWVAASALYMYHIGVRQFQMGIERAEGITSSGGDPNTMAITMVVCIPLSFLLMYKGNSTAVRIFGVATAVLSLYTIIHTGSRTAFLAFILLILMLVFQDKKNLKFIPLLIVAAPLFWFVIPAQYKARYQSIETRNNDESYTNRLLSWQGGVQMFLHNPVTGIGPENYAFANGMRYWPGTPRHWLNAHSLYFKLIAELGVVGTVAFAAYLLVLVRLNRSLRRRFEQGTHDVVTRNFPMYCNIVVYLLLFTGYSAHNLYRNSWYIYGAISAAIGFLKHSTEGPIAIGSPIKKQPAWIPSTEENVVRSLAKTELQYPSATKPLA